MAKVASDAQAIIRRAELEAQRILDAARSEAAAILEAARRREQDLWGARLHGYLSKNSGRNWQRRFFALRGSMLLYYATHEFGLTVDPMGVVVLDGAKLTYETNLQNVNARRRSSVVGFFVNDVYTSPHRFSIHRPNGHVWQFCAESGPVLASWVRTLLDTGFVTLEWDGPSPSTAASSLRSAVATATLPDLPAPAPVTEYYYGVPVAGALPKSTPGGMLKSGPRKPRPGSPTGTETFGRWRSDSDVSAITDVMPRRTSFAPVPAPYATGGADSDSVSVISEAPSAAPGAARGSPSPFAVTCPACSAALRVTAKFCHLCGTSVPPAPAFAEGGSDDDSEVSESASGRHEEAGGATLAAGDTAAAGEAVAEEGEVEDAE